MVATIPLVKIRLLTFALVGMLVFTILIILAPRSSYIYLGRLQFLGTVLALITMSLGAVLVHLTGKRLERLASVAQAIGQGQYATRTTDVHNDAIGQLGRSINQMAADIQQAVSRLEQQQQDLSSAYHTVQLQAQDLECVNRRLLALDRQRSEFIATVSHELRTPLNAIIGFSSVLLKSRSNDRDKRFLEKIHRNGRHLLGLINNILELARTETGKIQPIYHLIDPVSLLREVVEMLLPQAEAKQLYLQLYLGTPPAEISSDGNKLEQVLVNLIGNAIKFTPHGGVSIFLDTTLDHQLQIDIQDTGIGINGDEIHWIFEPFRQVDSGTDRRYEGTGLGLTIARNLVKLLNGEVSVESQLGKGSVFRVRLPLMATEDQYPALPTTFSIEDRIPT